MAQKKKSSQTALGRLLPSFRFMCIVSVHTLSPDIQANIQCLFPARCTSDAFTEPDDPLFPLAVLRSVGVALTYIPVQQLLKNSLPANLIADQKSNLPGALQTLLNTLCPLLLFKARPLQITVYLLLEK